MPLIAQDTRLAPQPSTPCTRQSGAGEPLDCAQYEELCLCKPRPSGVADRGDSRISRMRWSRNWGSSIMAVPEERIGVTHLGVDEHWFGTSRDARVAAPAALSIGPRLHTLGRVLSQNPAAGAATCRSILAACRAATPCRPGSEVQPVASRGRAGWRTDELVTDTARGGKRWSRGALKPTFMPRR